MKTNQMRMDKLYDLMRLCRDRYSDKEMLETFESLTDKEYQEYKTEDETISDLEGNGYTVLKLDTLAEVIKFEAFKEELITNPYQFKLAI